MKASRSFQWTAAAAMGLGVLLALGPFAPRADAQQMGQPGWETIASPDEMFQRGFIQVIGTSESGQSRFAALLAAKVVAQRDLLEVLEGVNVVGETTVQNGMLGSDIIRSRISGMLRGAVTCGERYHPTERYGEVCLRLNLRGRGGAYEAMLPMLQGPAAMAAPGAGMVRPGMGAAPMSAPSAPMMNMPAAPMFAPQAPMAAQAPAAAPQAPMASAPHDGLIIDMAGNTFRPAMGNRIFTDNGQLLYGPTRVAPAILIERGAVGFTNRMDKAQGLLRSWGAANPLVVQAVRVQDGVDVVVTGDNAQAIYQADQGASFLSRAMVVFLKNN